MARIILRKGITEDGKETVSGGMMARILIRETLTIREENKRTTVKLHKEWSGNY